MRLFVSVAIVLTSISAAAQSQSFEENNRRTLACAKSVAQFLKGSPNRNGYYLGQNSAGNCFLSAAIRKNFDGAILFVNSGELRNVPSIEMSVVDRNVTGIWTEILQCEVRGDSLAIQTIYRMPQTIYYRSDGAIGRSWSIFDSAESRSMELTKGANGRLAKVSVDGGRQTCLY